MLRPFQEQDTEQVVSVWLEASLRAHDFIPAAHWHAHVRDMRDLYLPSSDEIGVYEDRGAVRAFLALVDDYLAALFVHPDYQGMGVGTRLLRVAKGMHPQLCLTVYAKNHRAIRFYEKNGFRFTGRRIEQATGEEEWEMEWSMAETCGTAPQHHI